MLRLPTIAAMPRNLAPILRPAEPTPLLAAVMAVVVAHLMAEAVARPMAAEVEHHTAVAEADRILIDKFTA